MPCDDWLSPLCVFSSIAAIAYGFLFWKDWLARREDRGLPPLVSARMVKSVVTAIVLLFLLAVGLVAAFFWMGGFGYRE